MTARDQNLTVKMTGSGHSFTDIAVTDGMLLRPDSLRGIVGVDHDAMTVTALAGTPLHELNRALERLDLSLHNLGDIEEQTVAGAIATGTHGTGGRQASLSAQVAGLELVTGEGDLLRADAEENPDILDVARLGLGALGILTSVTLRVEPLFTLEAVEAPMRWDQALADFDELVGTNEHFEMYWFPHTDRLLTKRNNRTLDAAEPLSRARALVRRRVPLQPRLRLGQPAGQRQARPGPPAQRLRCPGTERAALQRRTAQGVHLTACRGLPGDGVRRAPGRRSAGAARPPRPRRAVRLEDRLPGRGADQPCRRRTPLPRQRPTTPSTSRCTPTRSRTTASYFRAVEDAHEEVRRPPALGQAAQPHRRGPRRRPTRAGRTSR